MEQAVTLISYYYTYLATFVNILFIHLLIYLSIFSHIYLLVYKLLGIQVLVCTGRVSEHLQQLKPVTSLRKKPVLISLKKTA